MSAMSWSRSETENGRDLLLSCCRVGLSVTNGRRRVGHLGVFYL